MTHYNYRLEEIIQEHISILENQGSLTEYDELEIRDYFYSSVEYYEEKGLSEMEAITLTKMKYGVPEEISREYEKVNYKGKISRYLSLGIGAISIMYFVLAIANITGSVLFHSLINFQNVLEGGLIGLAESLVIVGLFIILIRKWFFRFTKRWYSTLVFFLIYGVSRISLVLFYPVLDSGLNGIPNLPPPVHIDVFTPQGLLTMLVILVMSAYTSIAMFRDKRRLNYR